MTSAHQHHSRYSLPPPPQNSQNDFRLPSLKDLNFQYRSPNGTAPVPQPTPSTDLAPPQQEHPSNSRHVSAWGRPNPLPNPPPSSSLSHPHQQLTPPLSAGHDTSLKVDYPSQHENGGYAHPGMPLSAQITSAPASVNIGSQQRTDEPPQSPNQAKRSRNTSTSAGQSREARPSHPTYARPQYTSYPPVAQSSANSPYHQVPTGLPGPQNHSVQPAPPPPPPPHEQVHHHPMPVTAHPSYASPYQYMPPRAPIVHQQHPTHPSQPAHLNPYPSPGPPPSAPPPQGPWGQQPPQHQHPPSHQQPPPPPPLTQPPQQHVQQHPPHIPSHHQQPPASIPPNPPYMVPQHHLQPPLPPPPPQPAQPHAPQSQPQPQQPQQQHPHQFQQQQQQPIPYSRTTAIVPTSVDTRPTYPPSSNEPERISPGRTEAMTELSTQCSILYSFAHRYSQMQNNLLHAHPPQTELEEMSKRAQHVVRLLEDLRRMNYIPDTELGRVAASESMQESPDDPRPPKRPWEDISQDDAPQSEQNSLSEQYPASTTDPDTKPQSTAEQDMELIRTKRATTTASANGPPGQPKSKYRKRSRATPPGKCHSCNIRETPEWRRGPDGARTLCNACGLHYAKLMRKRDKNPNGDTPRIDLETLRASARAADIAEKASRSKQGSRSQQSEPSSPADVKQQTPQQHHQGTFQLVNVMAPANDQGTSTISNDANRAPPPPQTHSSMHAAASIPPPPWATPAPPPPPRVYASTDHLQHQSFMRSSQHNAPSR